MTTTRSDRPVDAGPTPRRSAERAALAGLAALGPLAVGGALVVLPYSAAATPAEIAAGAVAAPGGMSAALWWDLLVALTLVAGAVVVGGVASRASRWWGRVGAVLTVGAFGAMAVAVLPPDLVAEAGARGGIDPATTARLLETMTGHPVAVVALVGFLIGHVIGLVCLGVALWRGAVLAPWAALVLIVSAPLHLVFTAIVPVGALAGLAWALTGVGFALAVAADR